MKFRRVQAVLVKESRELARDPVTIGIAILMPLVLLFLFGYAVSLDVKNIRYAVSDRDNTPESRALSAAFVASGYFDLAGSMDDHELEAALDRGKIRMALVIPERFAARLASGTNSSVQILIDGTNSNIVSAFRTAGMPRVRTDVRVWYNPQLRSANYIVPGLLAVIMMSFPPLLTALAVVREKESRSIEQIYASPLTSTEFLVGKLLSYAAIALRWQRGA